MSDRVKFYTYIVGGALILPFIFYFCVINCGRDVIGLFTGGDIIYFNWRSLPILVCMPMVVFFEVLLISCFFTKDKKVNPTIMSFVNKAAVFICVIFFISVFSGPVITIFFAFSSYHSCASSGIFSGVYYVKDKTKCYSLTGVIPWGKGYGYNDDVKK